MAAERYISLDVRATRLKSAGSDVATSGYASATAARRGIKLLGEGSGVIRSAA
jgi:hypothetical protein